MNYWILVADGKDWSWKDFCNIDNDRDKCINNTKASWYARRTPSSKRLMPNMKHVKEGDMFIGYTSRTDSTFNTLGKIDGALYEEHICLSKIIDFQIPYNLRDAKGSNIIKQENIRKGINKLSKNTFGLLLSTCLSGNIDQDKILQNFKENI